jgi:phosphoserine phosphatase
MRGAPFDVIFFDCDSTLSAVEGIDELARRAGVFDEVAPLTRAAMEGTLSLDEVYGARLGLIRPDHAAIAWLGQRYVDAIVPGARETVAALLRLNKRVYILSGGIREAVVTLAKALGLEPECVHAVSLTFMETGAYAGYAEDSPLARAGGKAVQCRSLLAPGQRAALVGDGGTDLEAADAGVFVVGFGGVARRPVVMQNADAYCDAAHLTDTLAVLLTPEEYSRTLEH